jgi:hypothetical protein
LYLVDVALEHLDKHDCRQLNYYLNDYGSYYDYGTCVWNAMLLLVVLLTRLAPTFKNHPASSVPNDKHPVDAKHITFAAEVEMSPTALVDENNNVIS